MTRQTSPAPARLGGAAGVVLALLAPAATAQSVIVQGNTSAGLQFGTGESALTAGVNGQVRSETRTSSIGASGNLSFYLGSDDTDIAGTARLQGRQQFKRGAVDGGLAYSLTPFTFEDVADDLTLLGLDEGERTRFNVFGRVTRELSPLTNVALRAEYIQTDFDPVSIDYVPSDEYKASLRLNHALDPTTTVYADLGFGWFTSEDLVETKSFSTSASIGGQRQVDSRTAVTGGIGLEFVNTEETVGGLTTENWSTALLFSAGATVDYSDGAFRFGLSQEVSPAASGKLANTTTLSAGLTYTVNASSTFDLEGAFVRQKLLDSDEEADTVLRVSPGYAVEIARNVNATARYTLRAGDTTEHKFNIGVSRSFGGN